MSLSSGWPGSILFSIPSSPAISIAANAIYGLQLGSGGRNSTRFDLRECEYIGTRQAAERLRREYARLTGASNPGTSRLYEFVVGAMIAESAGPCLINPPTYHRASCESPAYPSPANRGSPAFQSDWCVCRPFPLSPKMGFGMNVTVLPLRLATFFTMYLYSSILSAERTSESNFRSISVCPPVATSW